MTICDNLALLNLEEISIHNYITFLVRINKASILVFRKTVDILLFHTKSKCLIFTSIKSKYQQADVSDDILSIIGLFVGPCRMNKSHFIFVLREKRRKRKAKN